MRELFVYYKVRAGRAVSAFARVRRMQACLTVRHAGLTTRLLRRPETTSGAQTWMEIYTVDPWHAPAGVGLELQAAIDAEAVALLPWLDGPRHTEVFIACGLQRGR